MLALLSRHMTRARLSLTLGILAGGGMLLATACRSGTPGYATPTSSMPATTGMATAVPAPPAPVTVSLGQSTRGPIVVDGAGRALYRFDRDAPGSGMSACNGACAGTWLPEPVVGEPVAAAGVGGVLGAITRTDGTQQLTLDGHPLYRYVGDRGAGDTTGDGFGGTWHVLHPTATQTTSATTASPGY